MARSFPGSDERSGGSRPSAAPTGFASAAMSTSRAWTYRTLAEFDVTEGQREVVRPGLASGSRIRTCRKSTRLKALDETENWWREWSGRHPVEGEWAEAVCAIADHAQGAWPMHPRAGWWPRPRPRCPSSPAACGTGTIAICWLRDATFTLMALMHAGYVKEAAEWRDGCSAPWPASHRRIQIIYGLAGERRLPELELPWLPGYQGASPVRIGNGASGASSA